MVLSRLAQLSLKRSLTILLVFAAGFAFLSSYAAFLAFERSALRKGQVRSLKTQALVLSQAVAADLDFGALFDSQKSLAFLTSNKHILAARIFDRDGQVFATYEGQQDVLPLPGAAPNLETESFHDQVLDLFVKIYQDGEFKGTLFLRSDQLEAQTLFKQSAKVMSAVGLGLMVLLLGAASLLQREVSTPILDLAATAKRISEQRDFSIRLRRVQGGEIGELTDSFNDMLDQLQERDARLLDYQEHLEELVVQRSEQLLQAKQLLSATLDALPVYIAILDQDGIILATNRKWEDCADPANRCIHGARVGDSYPAFCATLQGRPLEGQNFPNLAETLAAPQPSSQLDYDFESPEGHRWFTLLLSRFVTAGTYHVVVMHTDVTEQRQMETQLRQAQKLESIGQLASGIAHEINTPTQYIGDNAVFLQGAFQDLCDLVAPMATLLESAHCGACPGEQVRAAQEALERSDLAFLEEEIPKALAQSLEGVARVSRIVSAMKDFSHPGSSSKTPTDLNRAIESTSLVCRGEWKYIADLELDLAPDLPPVPCLPDEFNQVILNLLINAAHAVGDAVKGVQDRKGLIKVSTRLKGDQVEIRVADTGTGIPEAIRSRIFDPFFTTKGVGKGTGQGLAITYAVIVKKHGGTIAVASEPGKGTTFTLCLPLNEEPLP